MAIRILKLSKALSSATSIFFHLLNFSFPITCLAYLFVSFTIISSSSGVKNNWKTSKGDFVMATGEEKELMGLRLSVVVHSGSESAAAVSVSDPNWS